MPIVNQFSTYPSNAPYLAGLKEFSTCSESSNMPRIITTGRDLANTRGHNGQERQKTRAFALTCSEPQLTGPQLRGTERNC
jgi:hypothetical protein